MDCFTILAQTAGKAAQPAAGAETTAAQGAFVPVKFIWDQIVALNLVEALTFICFGVVCLLYGWRIFKILVVISFALIGLYIGTLVNEKLVGGNGMWLGVIGLVLMAVFSIPLMRWGVSILGAAAGGVLTGGIWYAFKLPEQYIWAGALAGLIAGGMISFIIFKIAIMLFTSFSGSGLIVVAVLAILYKYMGTAGKIEDLVFNQNWFLPAAFLVPTAVGVILQNRFVKGAKDWSL